MEYKKAAGMLRWIAPCFAALLAGLRVLILKTAFDDAGLLPRGSWALLGSVAAAACCFVLLWLFTVKLNRNPGRENAFSVQGVWLPLKLISVGLLLAGSVLTLRSLEHLSVKDAETLIPCAGVVSALLMGWNALREKRGPGFFWARLVPALFAGAALIIRFRNWSHDPLVIHIFPTLLAWTCYMVEMMLLSGFSLNAGHRRSAVLFGLCAGIFTCMTVPDYFLTERLSMPDLLTMLGLALWCVVAALELLRERTQAK